MLIMKCPSCQDYIHSSLLAEVKTVDCEHCGKQVPVANVLISSNGFTFERSDLLKRFFRYRNLLDEVIEERNAMSKNAATADVSLRSMDKFMTVLQGMMAGARDHFRYDFAVPLPTRLRYNRHECHGSLFNLSMDGASIDIPASNPLPRVNGEISLNFVLPDQNDSLIIAGAVCWTNRSNPEGRKGHSIGVHFTTMAEAHRSTLWTFISTMTRTREKKR
jgi:Tfp pilus assembly protein PilZ